MFRPTGQRIPFQLRVSLRNLLKGMNYERYWDYKCYGDHERYSDYGCFMEVIGIMNVIVIANA